MFIRDFLKLSQDFPLSLNGDHFLTWPHARGYLGIKAIFGKTDSLYELVHARENLNWLVEAAYFDDAKRLSLTFREMPHKWWYQYIGGRC